MSEKLAKLTPKQKLFCDEYLIDRNGTRAALAAGYKKRSAAEIASENLNKPNISKYIEERAQKIAEKALCTTEWVVEGFRREAQGKGEDTSSAARVAALKALSEFTGGFDKNKHKVEVSGELDIAERIQEARDRARQARA